MICLEVHIYNYQNKFRLPLQPNVFPMTGASLLSLYQIQTHRPLKRFPHHSKTKMKGFLSQAAACDGLLYSVNYNGQNSGTQGYALPLFQD